MQITNLLVIIIISDLLYIPASLPTQSSVDNKYFFATETIAWGDMETTTCNFSASGRDAFSVRTLIMIITSI